MQLVSNFPQVPLTTSNVGTDLARVDNQQKPHIVPPQETSKQHPERQLNQYDRSPQTNHPSIQEKAKEQQQHKDPNQEQSQQQQKQQQLIEQIQKNRLKNKPALTRRDLVQSTATARTQTAPTQAAPVPLATDLMPQVRQHIQHTYSLGVTNPRFGELDIQI
ncbi:hypothetical protein [Shewanella sp. NIFS-20-20]|uniref:hypothetical protein n=1 Tax=Shewanella sp. NIFS-20-20 TaxID=2853806 RepID=UPI001C4961A5|nr:hypothetical protein [Shewanella sp. NIFS-20-20]MBV7317293.1 hypothetical protein [Shewanella sp. NIFS-20-20]